MGKGIREPGASHESARTALGELIHQHVRLAIETAVREELRAALGARSYERSEVRRGYRNGTKTRTLTGPSRPVALTVPRARCSARRNGPRRSCRAISGGCAR